MLLPCLYQPAYQSQPDVMHTAGQSGLLTWGRGGREEVRGGDGTRVKRHVMKRKGDVKYWMEDVQVE